MPALNISSFKKLPTQIDTIEEEIPSTLTRYYRSSIKKILMRSNEDNYEDLQKMLKQNEKELLPEDNERKTVYQKNMFK